MISPWVQRRNWKWNMILLIQSVMWPKWTGTSLIYPTWTRILSFQGKSTTQSTMRKLEWVREMPNLTMILKLEGWVFEIFMLWSRINKIKFILNLSIKKVNKTQGAIWTEILFFKKLSWNIMTDWLLERTTCLWFWYQTLSQEPRMFKLKLLIGIMLRTNYISRRNSLRRNNFKKFRENERKKQNRFFFKSKGNLKNFRENWRNIRNLLKIINSRNNWKRLKLRIS